jgi:glucose-6-phosphate 1-dehydrogenase
MRISPDIAIGLGIRVKLPGERMVGNDVELILCKQAEADMPPYQRLLGDAFKASGELFARWTSLTRNGASLSRSLTTSHRFIDTRRENGDPRKQSGSSGPTGLGLTRISPRRRRRHRIQ